MSTPALPTGTGSPAGTHLLIHISDDAPVGSGWHLQALVQRLRARVLAAAHPAPALLALEIHDQQGHKLLTIDRAGPLVDIVLAPGIYRVTARRGTLLRSYTVALSPGRSFDLHLHLPLRRPAH